MSVTVETAPGRSRTVSAALVFSVLWGLASLFQVSATFWWFRNLAPLTGPGVAETMVAVAAVAVLLKPASGARLATLCGAQVVGAAALSPDLPNHRLITALAALAILLAAAASRSLDLGLLYRRSAPALRWIVIGLYGFAVFAKLNRDFLDPAVSCATDLYRAMGVWVPGLPSGLMPLLPMAVLLVEALIPALLLVPRWRLGGIWLGTAFHLALTLDPYRHFFDFSSTMLALLTVFLGDSVRVAASERWVESRRLLLAGFGLLWLAGMARSTVPGLMAFVAGRYLLWFLVVGALVWGLRWVRTEDVRDVPLRPAGRLAALVLVLVAVNGLMPYVGLKTRSSFDMYSNLRVEGSQPNHLLAEGGLDLWSLQDDLVILVGTSDPVLEERYIESGLAMTWFSFRSQVGGRADVEATYRRGEELVRVSGAEVDPPPYAARKLLGFRPVDPGATSRCQW